MEFSHVPVLLDECLEALSIWPGGIYLDGTAGGAGHSVAIAKRLTTGRLIATDRDPDAVKTAAARLAPYSCATVRQGEFTDIPRLLDEVGVATLSGALLDIGTSSHQLDTPERGFSYMAEDAPLDMRMSQVGLSAYDIINTASAEEITRILREYGEERFASRIARTIVAARAQKPIERTGELVELVRKSVPRGGAAGEGHPAKRTYQALRIAVNDELMQLSRGLEAIFERLGVGARFAVITFHSLEDRIVKQQFAAWCKGCTCPPDFPVCVCGNTPKAKAIAKKPILPTAEELQTNKRSASAKLRVIEKIT